MFKTEIDNLTRELYRTLREKDYELFLECVRIADLLSIRHSLSVKAAADIERTLVSHTLHIMEKYDESRKS